MWGVNDSSICRAVNGRLICGVVMVFTCGV